MKTPEFYQEEDFRVVIWRDKENNYEPERARSVPERARRGQRITEPYKREPLYFKSKTLRDITY